MSRDQRTASKVLATLEAESGKVLRGERSRQEAAARIREAGKHNTLGGWGWWAAGIGGVGCIILVVVLLAGNGVLAGPTATPIVTKRPATPTVTKRQATTLISVAETYHIGDEFISGWRSLWDECITFNFDVSLPVRNLTLKIETFGAEADNPIYLNGYQVAYLKPQGQVQPNYWSGTRSGSIATARLVSGRNTFRICSGRVTVAPEFSGDSDDFQIRNLVLIAEY